MSPLPKSPLRGKASRNLLAKLLPTTTEYKTTSGRTLGHRTRDYFYYWGAGVIVKQTRDNSSNREVFSASGYIHAVQRPGQQFQALKSLSLKPLPTTIQHRHRFPQISSSQCHLLTNLNRYLFSCSELLLPIGPAAFIVFRHRHSSPQITKSNTHTSRA